MENNNSTSNQIPITMKSFDIHLETKPDVNFPSFYYSAFYNDGDYPISNLKSLCQRIHDDIAIQVDSKWLGYHIDHASRQIFSCNRLSGALPINERDEFVRNLHLNYEIKECKHDYFMENANKVVAMLLNQIVDGLLNNNLELVHDNLKKIILFTK